VRRNDIVPPRQPCGRLRLLSRPHPLGQGTRDGSGWCRRRLAFQSAAHFSYLGDSG
jgi:hypothetical protein